MTKPTTDATEGVKLDQGKLRFDLIPPEAELALAAALTYGEAKYAARNWEKGMSWGRAYGGLRRHLTAFWAGEDFDPETGLPHLWLAMACLTFLISWQARSGDARGADDRAGKTAYTVDAVTTMTMKAIQKGLGGRRDGQP